MNESAVQLNEVKLLPQGWRWLKLGDVCQIIMGQSPPGHTYNKNGEGLPFFQGKVDFCELYPMPSVWCTQPMKTAEPNDILISVRAPVGPTNLCDQKCCIGRGLAAIRAGDKVETSFVLFFLRLIENQFSQTGQGSTFGAVTRDHLESISIPLPSLPEQKRIATKIQELMAEVERARTACEARLEAAKALPKAYLRQVFESEEAKKWERKRLGEVCEFSQYGLTAIATSDSKGFPYLRITDIGDSGNLKIDAMKSVDCDEKTYRNYALEEGDILFARSGSIGRTFLYSGIPPNAVFASYLIRFKLKREIIEPSYLFYFTRSPAYLSFIEEKKHILSQPNINAKEYGQLLIPIPSLPEQKRIAAELKDKMAGAENLKSSIQKQLDGINALPQAILRKAFSGEL